MSFLPFVFTFLLLLTLVGSFLFTSVMGTARESKLIEKQHVAYHALLSKQNIESFEKYKKEIEGGETPAGKPKSQVKEHNEEKAPRAFHDGAEGSKMNIYALYDTGNPKLQHHVKETLIRLIEILYGSYEFAKGKDMAYSIVKQMMEKEIESLEDVKFKSRELDAIYYKMLKGTNTSYPALSEYVRIDKKAKPIYFRYAPKQVIRAALGEELAAKVFELEKKNWRENHASKALKKVDFEPLLKADPKVPQELVNLLFNFKNDKKGTAQIHCEEHEKIRALHLINKSPF